MSRKNEVERLARLMLQDHGMLGAPVDPILLSRELGLKVYNAKFGTRQTHGLLAVRSGQGSIYVETDDSPARKRFTIAHEIGHYVLHFAHEDGEHEDRIDSFRTVSEPDASWTEDRRREWEANVFAAAILMDEGTVRNQWESLQSLDGMAAWFQVSQQAMAIRLSELGVPAG